MTASQLLDTAEISVNLVWKMEGSGNVAWYGGIYMVKIKLSDLLGKHKMNQRTLSEITGIRPNTLSKMYYEETKRIEIEQIDKICKAFECSISDLLEYMPNL